jgi:hypothetical protein
VVNPNRQNTGADFAESQLEVFVVRPVNFQLEGTIYLRQDGRDFDLHNDFDFIGFPYSVADRIIELR